MSVLSYFKSRRIVWKGRCGWKVLIAVWGLKMELEKVIIVGVKLLEQH